MFEPRRHVLEMTLKDGNLDVPGIGRYSCALDYNVSLADPGREEEGSIVICSAVSGTS